MRKENRRLKGDFNPRSSWRPFSDYHALFDTADYNGCQIIMHLYDDR